MMIYELRCHKLWSIGIQSYGDVCISDRPNIGIILLQLLPSSIPDISLADSFVSSRPSDHYFRSVCLSVCLFVCAEFFSAVFDPISMKLGHMLYVWI